MEAVAEQPAAEAASAAEPPTPEAPPSPPPPVEPPAAPAAPASGGGGFTLPTVTRARQLAETPELQDVVSKLLGLCAQEPATSICAVAEALARQQPGRFANAQALLQQALQEHNLSTKTPRLKGAGAATARAAPPAAANGARAKPAARAPAAASPARSSAPPAAAAAARPKPAPPPRKPAAASAPTPRSLLKSESVVSYLQGSKSRDQVAAGAAGGSGDSGAEEGGSPAAGGAAKAKAKAAPRGAAPGKAPASGARAGDPVPPKGTVDVDAWLAERRQKDEQRDKVRWARVHNDARFIEKLERQQEVRNRQLHEEEDARAKAAAAAANWNTVPFAPPETNKAQGALAATEEEQLFRKDAARLFGAQPVTPLINSGRG